MTNSSEMSQLGLATHTRLRALRGAITVDQDTPQAVEAAVAALSSASQGATCLSPDDVRSASFAVTPDMRSRSRATAARSRGWDQVPMLCVAGLMVEDAMPR